MTSTRQGASSATAGGGGEKSLSFRYHYPLANVLLPPGLVLDEGCGYGTGTMLLARKDRIVIGVDPDAKSIKRQTLAALPSNVRFQVKHEDRLPFATGSFDAAVSFEVIEHMTEQRTYIEEIARVVRPGGLFLISTPNRRATEPYYIDGLSPINIRHVHELYPEELWELTFPSFEPLEVMVFHSLDIRSRRSALEYQQTFPVPYRLRALVPLAARLSWLKLRGVSTPEGWLIEKTDWETLKSSKSLQNEDIILLARRRLS